MEQQVEYRRKFSTLKEKLPHGAIKEIAGKTGLHRSTVTLVLKGRLYNPEVLEEALKIIKRREDIFHKIEEATK